MRRGEDFYGRGIVKLDIEPMGGAFHADATLRALPGLGVVAGKCSGNAPMNVPGILIDSDDIGFSLAFAGEEAVFGCAAVRP